MPKPHKITKITLFKQKIRATKTLVMAIFHASTYFCTYPAREECPQYDKTLHCCISPNIRCGYRKKENSKTIQN